MGVRIIASSSGASLRSDGSASTRSTKPAVTGQRDASTRERANAAVPPGGSVLVLEKIPHPYYIERPFVLGSYLEQGMIDYRTVNDPQVLAEAVRGLGVTHVALEVSALDAAGDPFEAAVGKTGQKAIPAMFWTASCLANWVNLNRNSPAGIAELASAATLMQRVIVLDDTFYHGGPHLFFGVYYGGRSPLFGGDFRLSEEHFKRAAEINDNKLLLVDVLQAEYLDRQRLDRDAFHQHLTRVIEAPDNLAPDMALMNAIAKQQATQLIKAEDDWF